MFIKILEGLLSIFGVFKPLIEKWVKREERKPIDLLQEANEEIEFAQSMPESTRSERMKKLEAIQKAMEKKSRAMGR